MLWKLIGTANFQAVEVTVWTHRSCQAVSPTAWERGYLGPNRTDKMCARYHSIRFPFNIPWKSFRGLWSVEGVKLGFNCVHSNRFQIHIHTHLCISEFVCSASVFNHAINHVYTVLHVHTQIKAHWYHTHTHTHTQSHTHNSLCGTIQVVLKATISREATLHLSKGKQATSNYV